jgi:hypothetical protein
LATAAFRFAASTGDRTGRAELDTDGCGGRTGAVLGGAAGGAVGSLATTLPGVTTRVFTFSTTTCLLRPCEKLCRTVPCSAGRFKDNVFVPLTERVFSPALFGSLISHSF